MAAVLRSAFVIVIAAGCGRVHFEELPTSAIPMDGGGPRDGGGTRDGGGVFDGNGPFDARAPFDAGSPVDAAGVPDSGVAPDATAPMDAGPTPDAGGRDAGTPMTDAGTDAGGVVSGCTYACAVDLGARTNTCTGRIAGSIVMGTSFTAIVDMSGATELDETITVCDPTGWVAHLTDSPTGNGGGGDGGSTANDAEVDITSGTNIRVFPNQYGGSATPLTDDPAYLPASGCTTFTWTVRDQHFGSDRGGIALDSPFLFRIDPPMDSEGTPDALWYVGLNRTYSTSLRSGSGVTAATFCIH